MITMTGQSFHLLPDTSKPVCYQYNQTTVLSTVCATLCCLVPLSLRHLPIQVWVEDAAISLNPEN